MFCQICGHANRDASRFCNDCGNSMPDTLKGVPESQQQNPSRFYQWTTLIAVSIAIFVITILLLSNRSSNSRSTNVSAIVDSPSPSMSPQSIARNSNSTLVSAESKSRNSFRPKEKQIEEPVARSQKIVPVPSPEPSPSPKTSPIIQQINLEKAPIIGAPSSPMKSIRITGGPSTIDAAKYKSVPFEVPGEIKEGWLRGFFRFPGGVNDIQLIVLDPSGYDNFYNARQYRAIYDSGRTAGGRVNIQINPGKYYLIFNNGFSEDANKLVVSSLSIYHQ